jgi:hypothetical protein
MTREHEILTRVARVLSVRDDAMRVVKRTEEDLRLLAREYEQANGARGLALHHLAQSCRARGIEI